MIMFPIYVKKCKNKCHGEILAIYGFKSKQTKDERHFNGPICLLPVDMDESQQKLN